MNENIYNRQDNKIVSADNGSVKKEPASTDPKTLSDKDAKVIRKFLESVGIYEADALRIALTLAEGKNTVNTLSATDTLALNRFLNREVNKEQNTPQLIQAQRMNRVAMLTRRTADFCTKTELLAVNEALILFAVNEKHVADARNGLDKIEGMRTSQQPPSNNQGGLKMNK